MLLTKQSTGDCREQKEVAHMMSRMMLLVALAVVMAAMMVASAVPSFADPDRRGHYSQTGECLIKENPEQCDMTTTFAGRGVAGDPDGGGRASSTIKVDDATDLENPEGTITNTTQGGGPQQGGGNCFSVDNFPSREIPNQGGKGKRCPIYPDLRGRAGGY